MLTEFPRTPYTGSPVSENKPSRRLVNKGNTVPLAQKKCQMALVPCKPPRYGCAVRTRGGADESRFRTKEVASMRRTMMLVVVAAIVVLIAALPGTAIARSSGCSDPSSPAQGRKLYRRLRRWPPRRWRRRLHHGPRLWHARRLLRSRRTCLVGTTEESRGHSVGSRLFLCPGFPRIPHAGSSLSENTPSRQFVNISMRFAVSAYRLPRLRRRPTA
jgi:hypothetical protein